MGPVGAARQRREDAHHAAAFGAGGTVDAGPRGRGVGCRGLAAVHLLGQSGSAEREVGGAAGVGEEAEVPDAMEAVRERVQEKAADELVGCELHDLDGAVLAIVLPGERDMVVFDRDEAAVGDGDPVGVAAEPSSPKPHRAKR